MNQTISMLGKQLSHWLQDQKRPISLANQLNLPFFIIMTLNEGEIFL